MFDFFRFVQQHWKRIFFRAHKDRRSLAALLFLFGILAYVASYSVFLVKNPFAVGMLGLGSTAAWMIRRSHKKADETTFRLATYRVVDTKPADSAVDALRTETIRLWLLIWRASSEAFLKNKVLPEYTEVRTRRAILDLLHAMNLRQALPAEELTLHLTQDGGWANESVSKILFRRVELEAFQYSCGAINQLSPIEDLHRFPHMNIEPLVNCIDHSMWIARETYDIRRESEMAAMFYLRCVAEQERRNLISRNSEEQVQRILDEASAHAGSNDSDLLIGTEIVSETDDENLNLATIQSQMRFFGLRHALFLLESKGCDPTRL